MRGSIETTKSLGTPFSEACGLRVVEVRLHQRHVEKNTPSDFAERDGSGALLVPDPPERRAARFVKEGGQQADRVDVLVGSGGCGWLCGLVTARRCILIHSQTGRSQFDPLSVNDNQSRFPPM